MLADDPILTVRDVMPGPGCAWCSTGTCALRQRRECLPPRLGAVYYDNCGGRQPLPLIDTGADRPPAPQSCKARAILRQDLAQLVRFELDSVARGRRSYTRPAGRRGYRPYPPDLVAHGARRRRREIFDALSVPASALIPVRVIGSAGRMDGSGCSRAIVGNRHARRGQKYRGRVPCADPHRAAPEMKIGEEPGGNGVCLTVILIDGEHVLADVGPRRQRGHHVRRVAA